MYFRSGRGAGAYASSWSIILSARRRRPLSSRAEVDHKLDGDDRYLCGEGGELPPAQA